MMIVFAVFAVLVAATALLRGWKYFARSRGDWLVDGSGLVMQGVVVPLVGTLALAGLLAAIMPKLRGSLPMPFAAAFLLNFVVIDYAYYWNHRLLHGALWRWHIVHHTAARLDVLVTSRNTLWTPLLIVYVWVNAAFLFLLRDPSGFVLGISLTAALDLWRHSPLRVPRALSLLMITPRDHAWHHSRSRTDFNFGANLSLWDRIHGTYATDESAPDVLGVDLPMSTARRLLFPFQEAER
jgi:sterol desaturase/sphingolipid hydroxylase (fatty acid hydroxylase superfamily)